MKNLKNLHYKECCLSVFSYKKKLYKILVDFLFQSLYIEKKFLKYSYSFTNFCTEKDCSVSTDNKYTPAGNC